MISLPKLPLLVFSLSNLGFAFLFCFVLLFWVGSIIFLRCLLELVKFYTKFRGRGCQNVGCPKWRSWQPLSLPTICGKAKGISGSLIKCPTASRALLDSRTCSVPEAQDWPCGTLCKVLESIYTLWTVTEKIDFPSQTPIWYFWGVREKNKYQADEGSF